MTGALLDDDIPLDIMSSHHVADSSGKESAETPLFVPYEPNVGSRLYRFMIKDELKERSAVIAFCDVWTHGPKTGSPKWKIEVRPHYWLAGAARVCELTPALLPDRSAPR